MKQIQITCGNEYISSRDMDTHWQWTKVYGVGVTLLKLWMLNGSEETP